MFSAISAHEFRWRALFSLLIVIAGTFGFPYVLYFIVANSGCQGIGGACGALGVVTGLFSKLLILIAAGLIYAISAYKRMNWRFSPLWRIYVVAVLLGVGGDINSIGYFITLISKGNVIQTVPFFLSLFIFNFLPLIVLTTLLSMNFETNSKMENGIVAVSSASNVPVGKIYYITAMMMTVFQLSGVVGFFIPFDMFVLVAGIPVFLVVNWASDILSFIHGLAGCWLLFVLFSADDTPAVSNPQFGTSGRAPNAQQPMFGGRKS